MKIAGYDVTLRERQFYHARYRLRRRQGAGVLSAALDAIFWPDRETPYLSLRWR
jgi:hypothetical protein